MMVEKGKLIYECEIDKKNIINFSIILYVIFYPIANLLIYTVLINNNYSPTHMDMFLMLIIVFLIFLYIISIYTSNVKGTKIFEKGMDLLSINISMFIPFYRKFIDWNKINYIYYDYTIDEIDFITKENSRKHGFTLNSDDIIFHLMNDKEYRSNTPYITTETIEIIKQTMGKR